MDQGVRLHPDVLDAFRNGGRAVALVLTIVDEQFVLKTKLRIEDKTDQKAVLSQVAKSLSNAEPAIVLLPYDGLWVLIAWTPDKAPVASRMLYASLRNPMKATLGLENFHADWQLSSISECSLDGFNGRASNGRVTSAVMTRDEKEVAAMQKEAQPRCVRTAAMPMVALNDSTTMSGTLKDFAASKLASVVISMTSSLESFQVESKHEKLDRSALASALSAEPRFIILRLSPQSIVLVHYCPEESDRRMKMAYSTFKRNLVEAIATAGLENTQTVQISTAEELTDNDFESRFASTVASHSDKPMFSKPTRPGRGGARLK
ncbi:ADF-H domain-containing protein [Plasmodiophora brassicae]|uniref:ADF-H domain-containing protein n=1 Tax=Plasmodiophora brassicae TaxID=37360 RepID=A0A0G4IQE4_PLABS|nr:hypothetical protein PBRA_000714 [Plasmodiophora brassicae]SPQ97678.1 unnamed protein product [Plasmodiophora brassicae]